MTNTNKRLTALLKAGSELNFLTDTVPESGTIIENIQYVDDRTEEHRLDIIYPKTKQELYPFILNIHGGGFAVNTKDKIYRNYAMRLAGNNFAVVNINFRLSAEAEYPAQLQDVFAVLDFIEQFHTTYSLDIDNMFFCGDSSGAYMAAMTECILHSEVLSEHFGLSSNLKIKALALNCGFYDFVSFMGGDIKFPLRKDILEQLFGQKDYRNHKDFKYSSVINYLTKDFAPSYIMDTQLQSFATEGARLKTMLKRNNVESTLHIFGKQEQLFHAFNIASKYKQSETVINETFEFFNRFVTQQATE